LLCHARQSHDRGGAKTFLAIDGDTRRHVSRVHGRPRRTRQLRPTARVNPRKLIKRILHAPERGELQLRHYLPGLLDVRGLQVLLLFVPFQPPLAASAGTIPEAPGQDTPNPDVLMLQELAEIGMKMARAVAANGGALRA
jgi:hypothetical protein